MTSPLTQLKASRDATSGETYVPPREFAADGSLRRCDDTLVPATGVLHSWTEFRGEHYGIVDLDGGARIQTLLGPGPHNVGARYSDRRGETGQHPFQTRFSHD
jgi:uncharacterized OB-fold protein